ncbi:MAG: hypothetical protein NXI17_19145 [Alphaproteobacteria bacterium]|nr:hypothetical protein [Alphaproteobacteria bacterium]
MKFLIGGLGLLLTGLIFWAIAVGDFGAAGDFLLGKPWGIVSMVDLYLGFLLSAVVIFYAEPDKKVALIWLLPIFVLGNVVTALWFVLRGLTRLRAALAN